MKYIYIYSGVDSFFRVEYNSLKEMPKDILQKFISEDADCVATEGDFKVLIDYEKE